MYAHYCWSDGEREKAIEVLMNTQTRRTFDLLGLCLTFQSILLIERKEDLKARRNVGDIAQNTFDRENRDINRELRELSTNQGKPLFRRVRNYGLEKLNSEERQNVVTGLYHFSGICVRLWEFESAIDICSFVLERSLSLLRNEFEKRLSYAQGQLSRTRSTS